MPSRRRQKQQTRLAFSPLPSSSPAAKNYHKQVQDRAAAVTIEGSPSPAKRRKLEGGVTHDAEDELALDARNSLVSTVEVNNAQRESEDDPIPSSLRHSTVSRVKSRSRQQRLDFNNSRDASSFDAPIRLPSSSVRTQSSKGATMFSSQAQSRMVESSSDGSDVELPSARKLMKKSRAKATRKADVGRDEDSDEDDIVAPSRRSQKPKEGRMTRSSRTQVIVDSDDEGIITRAPRLAPEQISDDDEQDMPTTMGTQRRRPRRASGDDFISDSPVAEDSDDEVVTVTKSAKKRRRSASGSDRSEETTPKTPGRRRIKRPRQTTQQEKDELAEDLNFLGPSSDVESSSRPPRSTQSAQKDARQKALERLKRKRLGSVKEEEPKEDSSESNGGQGSDGQEVIEIEDDGGDGDDTAEEADEPRFVSSRQMFKEDAEDADFLAEDDEDGELGVPTDNIPIEFTRYASMKPKELFEFAVEWMVQKKINPAFQRDDPLYQLTFKKLDDEVRGLAASKFTSSAWTAMFTVALNARPEMRYEMIDRGSADHWMRDKCDACNRTGHPATYEIQFVGKPYHRETLEDIDNGDDEDEDEDSESGSSHGGKENNDEYDANGTAVASTDTIFYVGKFCYANARTAHQLQHWRWALNAYVEVWLERQGYGRAEEVHKRDKWSTKKRRKYANKILDRMKQEGEVKVLWKQFRDSIEEARNSKQGRFEALSP